MKTESQNLRILRYLSTGKPLTKLEALHKFGSWSLAQRIFELKADRWPIKSEMVTLNNGKRVASYFIEKARARKH